MNIGNKANSSLICRKVVLGGSAIQRRTVNAVGVSDRMLGITFFGIPVVTLPSAVIPLDSRAATALRAHQTKETFYRFEGVKSLSVVAMSCYLVGCSRKHGLALRQRWGMRMGQVTTLKRCIILRILCNIYIIYIIILFIDTWFSDFLQCVIARWFGQPLCWVNSEYNKYICSFFCRRDDLKSHAQIIAQYAFWSSRWLDKRASPWKYVEQRWYDLLDRDLSSAALAYLSRHTRISHVGLRNCQAMTSLMPVPSNLPV